MHLTHKLPWNGVSHHLRFVKGHKAVYEHPSGLVPLNDARQVADVLHFANVFADTIVDFAETERRKFPAQVQALDPLFPDEVADAARHGLQPFQSNRNRCMPLLPEMQHLSHWKLRDGERYTTSDADRADAVKFLVQQGQSEALLVLCQAVPLTSLFHLSWGHGFGVSHVAQDALQMYVLLNLAYAVQQQQLVKAQATCDAPPPQVFRLFDIDAVRRTVLECFTDHDYSAQNIMHYQFWSPYVQSRDDKDKAEFTDPAEVDPAALKAYMAHCFRVVYLYEMMLHEGGETDTKTYWAEEVRYAVKRAVLRLHLPDD